MAQPQGRFASYLDRLGVQPRGPATSALDPGVAPAVLESHLTQSAHLMLNVKISMSCWMIAAESATRRKLEAARSAGVPAVAGGGPYEIAAAQGRLPEYVELCANMGFSGIESGSGFAAPDLDPDSVVELAAEHGLEVQFELGGKHEGAFDAAAVDRLLEQGRAWLQAGAVRLVVEARESAVEIGLFDANGELAAPLADRLVEGVGLDRLVFEAPEKLSQFALLDHFGPDVLLGNVRLDEVLRVEIYRRGLHADAFGNPHLRPRGQGDGHRLPG